MTMPLFFAILSSLAFGLVGVTSTFMVTLIPMGVSIMPNNLEK